jgi:hypothetical protein
MSALRDLDLVDLGSTELFVAKDDFKFNAAHFVVLEVSVLECALDWRYVRISNVCVVCDVCSGLANDFTGTATVCHSL